MPILSHPTVDTLVAYHLGNLKSAELEAVIEHLETCRCCEARLVDLERQTDWIIETLRVCKAPCVNPGEPPA